MANILTVVTFAILISQASSSLISDEEKTVNSIYDDPVRIYEEHIGNFTTEQIKDYYETDKLEKWNKTRLFSYALPPTPPHYSKPRIPYGTETRTIQPSSVLSVSPKWESAADSGLSSLPIAQASHFIGAEPEITLQINQIPILGSRNDRIGSNGSSHNVARRTLDGIQRRNDTGAFTTSSSFKGVWVDKETSIRRQPMSFIPSNFEKELKELKHEIKLMKSLSNVDSLKSMASRLTARQMIVNRPNDSLKWRNET
ncbi:hypothetical protein Q1695_000085 [Nippostrongylus brasiliensis]|nr:hypothetical protein Q1695_000085 [Nippostrongylus brasiliensis]